MKYFSRTQTVIILLFSLVFVSYGAFSIAANKNDLISAAKKEGSVVWYSSLPVKAGEKMAKMFTEEYGIKVEVNRKGTYGLLQALDQEFRANRIRADLIHCSEPGEYINMKSAGRLEKYDIPEKTHFPKKYVDPAGFYYPMRAYIAGIMWNSDKLPAGIKISSWKDLLNPALKGLMVNNDASTGGGALYAYYDWKTELGEQWIKELSKQNLLIVDGYGPVSNLIESGERPVGPILSYRVWALRKKGVENIKATFPKEGVPLMVAPIGIVKGAPHPNAARLLMNFLLSAKAQSFMQEETGQHSLRDDVSPIDFLPQLKEINLWTTEEKIQYVMQHQRELQDEFAKYFK